MHNEQWSKHWSKQRPSSSNPNPPLTAVVFVRFCRPPNPWPGFKARGGSVQESILLLQVRMCLREWCVFVYLAVVRPPRFCQKPIFVQHSLFSQLLLCLQLFPLLSSSGLSVYIEPNSCLSGFPTIEVRPLRHDMTWQNADSCVNGTDGVGCSTPLPPPSPSLSS